MYIYLQEENNMPFIRTMWLNIKYSVTIFQRKMITLLSKYWNDCTRRSKM